MDFTLWLLAWWAVGIIVNLCFVAYLGGTQLIRMCRSWIVWLGVFGPILIIGYLMFFLEETDWARDFRENWKAIVNSRKNPKDHS